MRWQCCTTNTNYQTNRITCITARTKLFSPVVYLRLLTVKVRRRQWQLYKAVEPAQPLVFVNEHWFIHEIKRNGEKKKHPKNSLQPYQASLVCCDSVNSFDSTQSDKFNHFILSSNTRPFVCLSICIDHIRNHPSTFHFQWRRNFDAIIVYFIVDISITIFHST